MKNNILKFIEKMMNCIKKIFKCMKKTVIPIETLEKDLDQSIINCLKVKLDE